MDSPLILSLLILPFASIGLGVIALVIHGRETAAARRADAAEDERRRRERAGGCGAGNALKADANQ